jgi:hypothetical protein
MSYHPDLAATTFRKSSRSSGAQACVAIGFADGWAGVQDTKEHSDSRQRTTLVLPRAEFALFLETIS